MSQAAHLTRPDTNPQHVQKLLDENGQLIRALVENQALKGKPMECIQYQQTLHRNLVYLATLVDPSINVQSMLPPPGSNVMMHQRGPAPSSSAPAPPYSAAMASVDGHMTHQRQPQALTTGAAPTSHQWSEAHSQAQMPPTAMRHFGGQYGTSAPPPSSTANASMDGYPAAMWQGGVPPYGMQRAGLPPAMSLAQDERRRQLLRSQQEQMIQAQQARRMQVSMAQGYPAPPPGSGGMAAMNMAYSQSGAGNPQAPPGGGMHM